MEFTAIGVIHSPYKQKSQCPRQGKRTEDTTFEIEIFPEYEQGLQDIETLSHLIVLYQFEKPNREDLLVVTPWDSEPHGVFATRSPSRPNPIALGVVELIAKDKNRLVVKGLDALDGTPVLDIKPYIGRTDSVSDSCVGWLEKAAPQTGAPGTESGKTKN